MKLSIAGLVLAVSLGTVVCARASSISSATVYVNTPDPTNAADLANQGSGLAAANFTIGAGGINFLSPPSAYTVASFLNNPAFSNQVNGFTSSADIGALELVITGFITLNAGANSFVVGHDDGVVLNVTGFGDVVNAPGGTSYSTSPFTVTAGSGGDYAFSLEYAECCGGAADLTFAINSTPVGTTVTPEPSSFVLLGTGLAGVAAFTRRRLIRAFAAKR